MVEFLPRLCLHFFRQAVPRLREPAILIDYSQLLNNVIVEPIEEDEEHAAARWETQQSLFGEAVRLKLAILERSDSVLVLFGVSIQS